jgi:hypothetical protein
VEDNDKPMQGKITKVAERDKIMEEYKDNMKTTRQL